MICVKLIVCAEKKRAMSLGVIATVTVTPATGLGTGLDIRGVAQQSHRVAVVANDNEPWCRATFQFAGLEMAA
jgi:hypothetical protein